MPRYEWRVYSDDELLSRIAAHAIFHFQPGAYKLAVFVEGGTTAKASFACCDWPEDFVTDYDIPEIDCPFCGTSPKENLAWASYFYEQKTMAPYAGFPPAESCDNPEAQNLMPTDEQCPPITSTGPDTQPPSCALGCNSNGLCHSHNVFGECTHQLAWNLEPKFGEAPVSKVIIFKGDKIDFQATESAHNLFQITSQQDFDTCDFSDATAVANVEELFIGYTRTFDEAGTFFFSCGISCVGFPIGEGGITQEPGNESAQCHCTLGQKLMAEVLDSSEGLRCHDHAPFSNEQVPMTCPAGQVLAFATDNPAYGAMDENECSEFCTVPEALNFMVGVQQGSCGDQGFTGASTEKIVKLPNGQDLTVHVKRNEEPSTCHCHSYEEISCPADEVPGDTLYAEHIDEIEEFCTGILDGSEPDCPFECFQPMEVLHLHYLECPLREVDPTYLAVNATAKCHKAATAPAGTDCPVVSFGDSNQEPTDPPLPGTFEITPLHFHGCMQVNGTDTEGKVILEKCESGNTEQQWQYDALTGLIRSGLDDGMKCIQAGHHKMPPEDGGKVRIYGCDENNDLQQFHWPSALGSPITLQKYPKYCVTFRGEHADLGIDPIIVKKCSWIEKARRDGWMAM